MNRTAMRVGALCAITLALPLILPAADAAAPGVAGIRVEDAWVRGTVEGQEGTGAYFRITSEQAARLVGVSSPIAREAQIHLSKVDAGRMTMRRQDAVDLPAGKTVALDPGGLHVMLLGLSKAIDPGAGVSLTLVVESGGTRKTIPVMAKVRALGQ
jgi:copper(I)-binding protein